MIVRYVIIILFLFVSFSFADDPELIIGYKDVYDAEHSHDTTRIAVATDLGIFIFETETMNLLSYRLFDLGLKYLDWSPNDNYIFASYISATNPSAQENYILDSSSLETIIIIEDSLEFNIVGPSPAYKVWNIHSDKTVAFDSTEEYFYYLDNQYLKRININNDATEFIFTIDGRLLYAFDFLEDENNMWISTHDRQMYVYDIQTMEIITDVSTRGYIVDVSPNARYLLTYYVFYMYEQLTTSDDLIIIEDYEYHTLYQDYVGTLNYMNKFIIIDDDNIFASSWTGQIFTYDVTNDKFQNIRKYSTFRGMIYSQLGTPVSLSRNSILYNRYTISPYMWEYLWIEDINRQLLPLYNNNLLTFKNASDTHLILESPFKHLDVISQDKIDNATEETEYEFIEPSVFSDDDTLFASLTDINELQIWDASERIFLKKDITDATASSFQISFSSDNRFLALAQNQILLYDRQNDWTKIVLEEHMGSVYAIDFGTDTNNLVSCGEDGKIIVWDLNSMEGETILQIDQSIKFVSYFKDNSILYVTKNGAFYHLLNGESVLLNDELNLEDTHAIAITDDKKYLIIDGHVFDTKSGRKLGAFNHETPYKKIDVSADNQWIGVLQEDRVVRIKNFQNIIKQQSNVDQYQFLK